MVCYAIKLYTVYFVPHVTPDMMYWATRIHDNYVNLAMAGDKKCGYDLLKLKA